MSRLRRLNSSSSRLSSICESGGGRRRGTPRRMSAGIERSRSNDATPISANIARSSASVLGMYSTIFIQGSSVDIWGRLKSVVRFCGQALKPDIQPHHAHTEKVFSLHVT